jgi:predicted transposase/invertase (TIGR01784 family)
MSQKIDPKIDCVFKALLGDEKNKNLLIHFLNAVLSLKKGSKITSVEILNPYNEKEFIGDKLSVVDIKAKDENDKMYQIEIQIKIHDFLISRMIYNWAKIYQSQISEGEDYESLNPVISIWILGGSLYPKNKKCHLEFKFSDIQEKLVLSDQAAIHVFQLPKWKKSSKITSEKDRWLCLFKEGKKLDLKNPPEYFQTKEMRQVMKVLKRFSERERDALMYQHRLHQMTKEQTFLNMSKKARKAFKERDSAFLERDSAFLERDSAFLERNKAVTERNNVIVERDNAFEALKEKENEINKLKNKLRKS